MASMARLPQKCWIEFVGTLDMTDRTISAVISAMEVHTKSTPTRAAAYWPSEMVRRLFSGRIGDAKPGAVCSETKRTAPSSGSLVPTNDENCGVSSSDIDKDPPLLGRGFGNYLCHVQHHR